MLLQLVGVGPLVALASLVACAPPSVPLSSVATVATVTVAAEPLGGPALQVASVSGMACARGEVVEVLGKLFCSVDERLAWTAAEARCGALGGRLARLGSQVDAVALRAAVGSPVAAPALWIDLRRGQDGWHWGSSEAARVVARWGEGEPNDAGGGEDCGEWLTSTGRFNDVACASQKAVLCEVSDVNACAADGVETSHGQYCVYPRAALGHAQARTLCERGAGVLAKLESAAENDALRQALGSLLGADRVWVGMTDTAAEGSWNWVDADAVSGGWLPGEPNDADGNEDCGEWQPSTGGFNDMPCEHRQPALCEITRT